MPEPILISMATTLATKAAGGLYELVRTRFAGHGEHTRALEGAIEVPDSPTRINALATALGEAKAADPAFGVRLRAEWSQVSVRQTAGKGGDNNQVSGHVTGTVVQARDIQGGINF